MRQWNRALATVVLCFCTGQAISQDLFRSTGNTTRSYNYIEVQYLADQEASPPILAVASFDITESFSFGLEYLNQSEKERGEDFTSEFQGEGWSIGVLYHRPAGFISDSDLVLGLSVGQLDVGVDFAGVNASDTAFSLNYSGTSIFTGLYAGIRRTVSERVEAELGLFVSRLGRYSGSLRQLIDDFDLSLDENETDITGNLGMVFRILPRIDAALSVTNIGDSELYGLGLRYTWN